MEEQKVGEEKVAERELQKVAEPARQPVVFKQFDFEEFLGNSMVQSLLGSVTTFLSTRAETDKIAEETEKERVKVELQIFELKTKDRQDARRFNFRQDIVNRLHSIIIFFGICGLFIFLWKLQILDKNVVQILIPFFVAFLAGGADFKSMMSKKKESKEKDDKD